MYAIITYHKDESSLVVRIYSMVVIVNGNSTGDHC
jgi:hypothetical protein